MGENGIDAHSQITKGPTTKIRGVTRRGGARAIRWGGARPVRWEGEWDGDGGPTLTRPRVNAEFEGAPHRWHPQLVPSLGIGKGNSHDLTCRGDILRGGLGWGGGDQLDEARRDARLGVRIEDAVGRVGVVEERPMDDGDVRRAEVDEGAAHVEQWTVVIE